MNDEEQNHSILILGDSSVARIRESIITEGLRGVVANLAISGQTTRELVDNLRKKNTLCQSLARSLL